MELDRNSETNIIMDNKSGQVNVQSYTIMESYESQESFEQLLLRI